MNEPTIRIGVVRTYGQSKRHKSRSDRQKIRRLFRRRFRRFAGKVNTGPFIGDVHPAGWVLDKITTVSRYEGYYTLRIDAHRPPQFGT